jgi:hypothetical protein
MVWRRYRMADVAWVLGKLITPDWLKAERSHDARRAQVKRCNDRVRGFTPSHTPAFLTAAGELTGGTTPPAATHSKPQDEGY